MNNKARKRTTAVRAGVVVAVALLGAAACSDDSDGGGDASSSAEATETFCQMRRDFAATVAGVPNLDPATATVGDVEDARDDIDDAVDDLGGAAADVAAAEADDVREAYDEFLDTLGDVDEDELVASAVGDVQTARENVTAAVDALFTEPSCT